MHRYYMTSETRKALIAESNRLIAARAATHIRPGTSHGAHDPASNDRETRARNESAFARLVSDLQSVAQAA